MKDKTIQLYKGDFLIIGLVVVVAISILVAMLPKESSNTVVEIYQNGTLLHTIPLEEGVQTTLEIEGLVHNTIEIDGLQVGVIESTCYDHVCQQEGYISHVGEIIVCMPNQLLIKILGDTAEGQLDGVVG